MRPTIYDTPSVRKNIVHLWFGTNFKKCKEKWVEKVSKMWVPHLYICFIIECECNELVESELYLSKVEKKQCGQHFTDERVKSKSGQLMEDERR